MTPVAAVTVEPAETVVLAEMAPVTPPALIAPFKVVIVPVPSADTPPVVAMTPVAAVTVEPAETVVLAVTAPVVPPALIGPSVVETPPVPPTVTVPPAPGFTLTVVPAAKDEVVVNPPFEVKRATSEAAAPL